MPAIVDAVSQRRATEDNCSLIRWSGTRGDALETEGQTQQNAHLGRLALMGEIAASLAHELNQPSGLVLTKPNSEV
jgi:C4-dicarboxylate-specific signal transduction histidine kinase